ncbi:MAG: anthranilate phosphoribosyltransferase [bacterium]|nr:anthranilate phosphoribosyltransferase [bacterium]
MRRWLVRTLLEKLIAGQDLTCGESAQAFETIMAGEAPDALLGAFLAALAVKGETVEEITGAAQAMRTHATPIHCAEDCIDTCGAGGDGISTFNVSTTAALVAAAAGATVAKHGNVTNTRVSGSAEVLQALGVRIDCPPTTVERCLQEIGIGFLFARALHPAMKHAAGARRALGVRTIFNLLGPLTNPAGAQRQVLGVPRPELTETIAEVLGQLGAVHAMVVHGLDGLCDLTVTAETRITELRDGRIETRRISPENLGVPRACLADLAVNSAEESAQVVRGILSGTPGPARDHTLLNAAAALVVAGRADDLPAGFRAAGEAIDDHRAKKTLDRLVELTNA